MKPRIIYHPNKEIQLFSRSKLYLECQQIITFQHFYMIIDGLLLLWNKKIQFLVAIPF